LLQMTGASPPVILSPLVPLCLFPLHVKLWRSPSSALVVRPSYFPPAQVFPSYPFFSVPELAFLAESFTPPLAHRSGGNLAEIPPRSKVSPPALVPYHSLFFPPAKSACQSPENTAPRPPTPRAPPPPSFSEDHRRSLA